ncbi:uncharacterized protein LOC112900473 [Panicum hallii]|uniref:uncharacterized protein LOC112900473 n=1 Tax=Panicum hallii TaxID=206008 RepID=UPI000DF4E823|nr:uncharacterized protein LOC112900473 [Panicum hallii]
MASLPFPRRFQSQDQLDAVRRLMGWTTPANAGKVRLGDRINTVSARYAEERAELVAGRELLREELEQARVREAAALQREKATVRREVAALEGLKAVEELKEAVADRERVARELAAEARKASAAVEAEKADLADLAAAVAKKEELLAARAQQLTTEEVVGTFGRPDELLLAGSGCHDAVAADLVGDQLLIDDNIENLKKAHDFAMSVIAHSRKQKEEMRAIACDRKELAALRRRLEDEKMENVNLEKEEEERIRKRQWDVEALVEYEIGEEERRRITVVDSGAPAN